MTDDDVPEVAELELRSFRMAWSEAAFRHEIQNNPSSHGFVVRAEGSELAAYASTWFLEGKLRINNLAVTPAHRGRGIGLGLLGFLLDAARNAGCREALLEVRASNRPARRLYRRLGFRRHAVRRWYYSDGEDALVLRLDLDGPTSSGETGAHPAG